MKAVGKVFVKLFLSLTSIILIPIFYLLGHFAAWFAYTGDPEIAKLAMQPQRNMGILDLLLVTITCIWYLNWGCLKSFKIWIASMLICIGLISFLSILYGQLFAILSFGQIFIYEGISRLITLALSLGYIYMAKQKQLEQNARYTTF